MEKYIYLFFLALFIPACYSEPDPSDDDRGAADTGPPNIVWIVAEDLSEYIPSFGDSTISTPHLSRLAAEGICYDNFFTPAPVCAPARSAIATGMYPTRIGTQHMRTGPWFAYHVPQATIDRTAQWFPKGTVPYEGLPDPEVKMMSEYLRKVGYYCTNNSKEDYQFRRTLTAWDESGKEAHWKNREKDQPFFAIFNLGVTHESQIWSRAEDSLWVPEDLKVSVPPYLPDTEVGRRDIRRMYSNIKMMDHQVGQLLKELEEAGLMEQTVIFWYTDHGGPLPRQKRLLYDSGLKVPMIIRFPKQAGAGMRNEELLSFIDLAPTVLSLADITPPDYMDGKAFLGPHQQIEGRDYIFAAADRFDAQYDTNRAVRDKRYKLIRYYQPDKPMFLPVEYREQMAIMRELHRLKEAGQLTRDQALWFRETKPELEFFDTQADPHEVNNLADDPAFAEKIATMSQALKEWMEDTQDRGMMPEEEYLAKIWPGLQQPQTREPEYQLEEGQLILDSPTVGASIAYQIIETGAPAPRSWEVYHQPVEWTGKDTLKVVAHRLGYLPSTTLVLPPRVN